MTHTARRPDHAAVTARQRRTWSAGDFNVIARQHVPMAEALCDAAELHAGERVLDVACGSGTAALVAARRYCEVAGIDYVPALVDRARLRARCEDLEAVFTVADAQALPFADGAFDAVLSVFGVQFAPDQRRAAAELLRVCRPGGRIALASPGPAGYSGDLFALHAQYVPPPPDVAPALRWGHAEAVAALLGDGCQDVRSRPHTIHQYYRSVGHAVEVFTTHFGPSVRAVERADAPVRERFLSDLGGLFARYNRATDGTARIESTYTLTIAVRA